MMCGAWYATTADAAGVPPGELMGCLSRATSLYLLASITVSFLASSSAPTPLYPIYQAEWGFSATAISFVFGIYAIAVLGALLVAGRLSDYVGRRPVLIVATAIQAATMLLFAFADGLSDLIAARVIQGLATGVAIAAVGAGMLDMDKARGAVANSVAPAGGTALGGVVAGFMVHYLPAPTHFVYFVLAAIFVAQVVGVLFIPELIPPRAGAMASLRPRFSLPAATRQPILIAAPVLIAVWALAGFYGSLGPSLLRTSFGLDSSLAGGIALFVLAGSGGTSVLLTQRLSARTLMLYGPSVLLAGVGLALASLSYHSPLANGVLPWDSACRERLRHRLPGRHQDRGAARRATGARRRAVGDICGLLPRHGFAGGDRPVRRRAPARPFPDCAGVRCGRPGARRGR